MTDTKIPQWAMDRAAEVHADFARSWVTDNLTVLIARALATVQRETIEQCAKWHDEQVQEYTKQIAVNDAYLARVGKRSYDSIANEYCDDMRSMHRRSATTIRALSERTTNDTD